MIFFSNKVEKFIPPKKGKSHILRIIRELLEFTPENRETNISEAMRYFTNAIKKRSISFILSDFMDEGFSDALSIANRKHDVVALKLFDKRETEIPSIGLVKMKDAETGQFMWVDTTNRKVREQYAQWWINKNNDLQEIFKKAGVDFAELSTGEDYVKPLMKLFKKR